MKPIEKNHKLIKTNEDPTVDREMYQILVEMFIYLAHTRLDVTYAVKIVYQFMHSMREVHLHAICRIIYYLMAILTNEIYSKRTLD